MALKQANHPSNTGRQHSFAEIPRAEIQRSSFNRSCGLKTTFEAGFLIPIFCDEALPGDTMSMKMASFGRMATPLYPVMDNQALDYFFFFVPNRLLWDNWEKFNGAQDDPGDSTDFLVPTITSPASVGHVEESIHDYIGIPPAIPDLVHTALFHRAYNRIWTDWFRDENLQDSLILNTDNGPDDPADYALMRRGKRKDYFTSCLPWPQKGPAVELPLGTSAPVVPLSGASPISTPIFEPEGGSGGPDAMEIDSGGVFSHGDPSGGPEDLKWTTTGLEADLTNATAATINQLRQAFQIQKLYERDARGGTRYTEILRAHFGVTSPDQRLQRPEFLGGGSSVISVMPVAETNSQAASVVGALGAFATSIGTNVGFHKSFVEHGVIMGFVASRADLNYQQGLQRQFSRSTRWDFFWPALAHLGEQAVLNKEIYAQGTAVPDDDVFGYQERFAEYRYKPSQTTGAMRSQHTLTLHQWHLAQDFSVLPVLDDTFIEENPPLDRVLAVSGETQFLLDLFFDYKSARPMPTYGVPGLIDHF